MSIKRKFRRILWKFGYDFCRFTPASHPTAPRFYPLARRKQILELYDIDTVLDIGANTGKFARQLRHNIGFPYRILSFEPVSAAFEVLQTNAKDDPAWEVFNYAIGNVEEEREINIARNTESSSFLNMLPAHRTYAPDSQYIGKEKISIKILDSLFGDLCKTSQNIYMKIDTQGFESQVLQGAERSLPHIDTVQMEMSLVPLYDGELVFHEMCMLMGKKDYTLIAIENGFSDPASGQLLQIDGIFHRFRQGDHE